MMRRTYTFEKTGKEIFTLWRFVIKLYNVHNVLAMDVTRKQHFLAMPLEEKNWQD